MKFQKGNTGKPKGAKNKVGLALRETISDFLTDNFTKIEKDFSKLSPKDRARLYCDLLQYGLPKLQSVNLGVEPENEVIYVTISGNKKNNDYNCANQNTNL